MEIRSLFSATTSSSCDLTWSHWVQFFYILLNIEKVHFMVLFPGFHALSSRGSIIFTVPVAGAGKNLPENWADTTFAAVPLGMAAP